MMCCYHANSFLILLVTIKTGIALILKGVSINTHSVISKKKKISLQYSDSFPSPLPRTHLFLISLLKKVEKRKKNIFYTLSFSRYHPQRQTPFIFISLEKKILEKEAKNKKKRKGREILNIF